MAANAARARHDARQAAPRLRGDLDTIVAKALKKNPQERYASVAALADDLRRYLRHEPIGARPDTSPIAPPSSCAGTGRGRLSALAALAPRRRGRHAAAGADGAQAARLRVAPTVARGED